MRGSKAKRTRAGAARERLNGGNGTVGRFLFLRRHGVHVLVVVALAVGLFRILVAGYPPLDVKVGDRAPRDFFARVTYSYSVFRVDRGQFEESAGALVKAIQEGEENRLWDRLPARAEASELIPLLREKLDALQAALESLKGQLVCEDGALHDIAVAQGRDEWLYVRAETDVVVLDRAEIVSLSAGSAGFREAFRQVLADLAPEQREAALTALARLLRPTMAPFGEASLARAGHRWMGCLPRVDHRVFAGAVIVSKDAELTRRAFRQLRAERERYDESEQGRRVRLQRHVGLAVLILTILAVGCIHVVRYERRLVSSRLQVLAFAVWTLCFVGLARLFVLLGIPVLLVPVPLTVMSFCLLYDQRFGFEMSIFFGLLIGLASADAGRVFLVLTLGGMVAALVVGRVQRRSTLIKAGIIAGLVQMALVLGLGLLRAEERAGATVRFWQAGLFRDSVAALCNGVMSGFLLSGLLPAIERLFGVTTDIRLLEWSDPNQPLLQRLLLDAAGTYHHSMVVGGLAADASEAIGANPLLARVGAYFHDVGKLNKPDYFVENLPEGAPNPHDELSPSMSSLVITGHPKDGAEMARRHGLPKEVCDIILESHGSSVVKYFYGRAKQQEGGEQKGSPKEETYRYRLPKPRSKESAIVMMCDSVESAARSLDSPTSARIEKLVHELIMEKLHDGQLENSGLTITDLSHIERSLIRGVSAVFHNRIAYPGQEGEETDGQDVEDAGANNESPELS